MKEKNTYYLINHTKFKVKRNFIPCFCNLCFNSLLFWTGKVVIQQLKSFNITSYKYQGTIGNQRKKNFCLEYYNKIKVDRNF